MSGGSPRSTGSSGSSCETIEGKERVMRVVECDICGETINADSDAELKARLGEHLAATHDRGTSPEELDQLVAAEAYEATDS